jgi:hypothetical protein
MSELSPAATAVLNAYMDNCGWLDGPFEKDYRCAAAVLRAAADQVVPAPRLPYDSCCDVHASAIRAELLAIAIELETH